MAVLVAMVAAGASACAEVDSASLRAVPVMHEGRVMPLDTFAREFAEDVGGGETVAGRDHMQLLLLFWLDPETAVDEPVFYIRSKALTEALALPAGRSHFSFTEIMQNQRLQAMFQGAGPKQSVMRDVTELLTLLNHARAVSQDLRVVPPLGDSAMWQALPEIENSQEIVHVRVREAFVDMEKAYVKHRGAEFAVAAGQFAAALKAVNPGKWPVGGMMSFEVAGNEINPIQKAWIGYLAAVVAATAVFFAGKRRLTWIPLVMMLLAVGFHVTGLAMRGIEGGRAPLSGMYESVVFAGLVAAVLGLILWAAEGRAYFAWAGAVVAAAALLLASALPGGWALRPPPLEARSDVWLAVHVGTTLAGFGAFLLAAVLAHYALGVYCFRTSNVALFESISARIYRVLQGGIVFFIVGTITGGLWASVTWGRFWGWDTKQSWALITILLYVGIVHARSCGWVRQFGLVIGAIWGFLAVLMTWYGVNYILKTGLHDYGWGTGAIVGGGVVAAVEVLVILVALMIRTSQVSNAVKTEGQES
jgi:ABC-type transport system involved in cytochrome c biogenesis permease subunit